MNETLATTALPADAQPALAEGAMPLGRNDVGAEALPGLAGALHPAHAWGARARPSVTRRMVLGVGALAIAAGGGAWWITRSSGAAGSTNAAANPLPAPVPGLTVRGVVRPAAWSRVGTQLGGVVSMIPVDSGESVAQGQVLARIRSPLDGSIEVVSAPRSGTITARAVSHGDSVVPGSTLFIISDMSTLRVEVADVDEFTVARVHRGQRATVSVPALDVHGVAAIIRSVGAQPVGASVPDAAMAATSDHYPVSVDLIDEVPGLRIGMAARVRIEE
jgi:multidrug efflux pump subunit AcrA (membrane-fusion protein)